MSKMPKFENLEKYIDHVWKTRAAFAEAVGVSKNLVTQWLKLRQRITPEYEKRIRGLKPAYDGPLPEPGTALTRAELDAAEKRIESLIHWHHQEMQKSLQALGAASAVTISELAELKEKLKG